MIAGIRLLLSLGLIAAAALPALAGPQQPAAQAAGSVSGVVIDRQTRRPVPGAVVSIESSGLRVVTDATGGFRLHPVPAGTHTVRCEAPGYRPTVIQGIEIGSGADREVVVDLESELLRRLEEVSVEAPTPRRGQDQPIGGVTIGGPETAIGAGAMGDFGRWLRAASPAGGMSDERNTLVVRGGNPIENGFFLDNIELPGISHLPDFGSTGGYYSLIDPSMVREFDFMAGGLPADHGGRLSSITEIGYREGSRERVSGSGRYDIAMGGATAEGPLAGGRGSWLGSVRRADFLLLGDLLKWDNAQPRWTDAHAKVVYDLTPRHAIWLIDVYSGDRLLEDEGAGRTRLHRLSQNTVGANWLATWSRRIRSETSVSHSRATWRHGQRYPPPYDRYDWHDDRETEWVALRNRNWLALGQSSRLEFGVQARTSSQSLTHVIRDPTAPGVTFPERTTWTYETVDTAAFASATVTTLRRLVVTAGVRLDHSSASRRSHASPRVSVSYPLIGDILRVNAAAAVVHQPLPAEFLAVHPEFLELRDMRAVHYGLGLAAGRNGWRTTLEAYFKAYSSLPIDPSFAHRLILDKEPFRSYTIPDRLIALGTGSARGVELTVERRVGDTFAGVLVARAGRDRFRDANGIERNRLYDSRYGFSAAANYALGGRWLVSGSLVIQDGTPYTATDEVRSSQYGVWIRRAPYNGARYPAYVTLNVRAERRFAVGSTTVSVYADVWNLLGRENVAWIDDWSPLFGDEFEYQMPRTPFIGAAIAF